MNKFFLVLLLLCNFKLFAEEIVLIEVYSLPFNKTYSIGMNKYDVRKNYDIGIKIKNQDIINSLNVKQTVNNLKLSNILNADDFGDFRTFIIFRFQNGKSRKFYITGTGYIIENKKVYGLNLNFLKMVYTFLPDNFKPYYPIWENK